MDTYTVVLNGFI